MNQLMEVRTATVIATEIVSIKGQARQVILYSSVEIGRRLNEAKELVPHGEWGHWLQENVDYSQSTANNLMQLYREYGTESQALGNLSYTKALALLGVPETEREQFVQDNDVEHMSARELQQAIKEKQQLEQQLKKSEEKAEKDRVAALQLAEKYAQLEKESTEHNESVQRLSAQLEEAKQSGNADEARKLNEELQKSKDELAASRSRVQALETELEKKPVDVSGVVEKIPEEIEMELAELRKKVSQPNGHSAVRFRLCFESLTKGFQDLLGALGEVKEESPDAHDKYRSAVSGLIGKMSERLS